MLSRKKLSAERLGLRNEEQRQLAAKREKDAANREKMLDAMRGLCFEAVCETFAGHVLGRPDATPEHKHRALQEMERIAFADLPAE